MENPFTILERRLNRLEALLIELKDNQKALEKPPEKDQWLSIDELVEYLPGNPSKATIYGKVHRNEVPHKKFGKRLVFLKSEIDQFIENHHQSTNEEIEERANQYVNNGGNYGK